MILTESEIHKSLVSFSGWEIKKAKIIKTFKFPSFLKAIEFVNKVAKVSEAEKHHPDIKISYNPSGIHPDILYPSGYNVIKLELSTHSEKGVSEKDISLAKKIERI